MAGVKKMGFAPELASTNPMQGLSLTQIVLT
jgi:hypothetical protein